MIVPDFWAEARKQHRTPRSQVTVRRFGWSTISQADAQAMAEKRVEEALERILSGQKLDRREKKRSYNGADGVPIREEVLARYGEEVITRNGYGAHCLNSPRVLFADIDFATKRLLWPSVLAFALLAAASIGIGIWLRKGWVTAVLLLVSGLIAVLISELLSRLVQKSTDTLEAIAREKIVAFVAANRTWNLRLYRTTVCAPARTVSALGSLPSRGERVFRTISARDPVSGLSGKSQCRFEWHGLPGTSKRLQDSQRVVT